MIFGYHTKARRHEERTMIDIEEIARRAIDCGLHIHKKLGPGLLESVYEALLAASLERDGLLMNFGCETFRDGPKRVVNGPSAYEGTRERSN